MPGKSKKGEFIPVQNNEETKNTEIFTSLNEESYPFQPYASEEDVSYESRGCSKYSKAFKTMIPCRKPRKDKTKLPSNEAGLISFFSLTWLTKLMFKAYRKGLEISDLWILQKEDSAEVTGNRMKRLWKEEQSLAKQQNRPPELWRSTWRAARTRVLFTVILSLGLNVLQFLGPTVILKLTLDYITQPETDHFYGGYIVLALFVVNIVRGAIFNLQFVIGTHTATRIIGGTQSFVFEKALRLKTGGEKLSTQLTNIFSNDMERLFEAVISSVFLTATPALFTMSLIYGIIIIGPWSLVGMLVYFVFFPVMGTIAKGQSAIRVKTVKKTDKRVSLMSEILNSMKLIKMYSWEESFSKKVATIRNEEMKRHKIASLLQAVSSTMVPGVSILAAICTILPYTLSGLPLTSAEAFTIYSTFQYMQFTIGVLPFTIRSIAEAKISLARIQRVMGLPEHHKDTSGLFNNNLALGIKGATFAWEIHSIDLKNPNVPPIKNKDKKKKNKNGKIKESDSKESEKETLMKVTIVPAQKNSPVKNGTPTKIVINSSDKEKSTVDFEEETTTSSSSPNKIEKSEDSTVEITQTLFGLNLSVEKGKLIGICGSVGSGKSSLMSAICGDMKIRKGDLQVNGRLALVSQQAWIYNATLRENILVGERYDKEKYDSTIDVCCLKQDFDLLPNRDLSEIGEKGVNLSGGQKQRVNLARAVYSDRDIYLLDDPLSAVDTKVAKELFNNCIKGTLKDKTVLLVSHGVHFLEQCDEIILMKNGRIHERGTHKNLIERKGEYCEMVGFDNTNQDVGDAHPDNLKLKNDKEEEKKSTGEAKDPTDGKLIKEESKAVGSIGGKVYLGFIKACGGWCACFIIFLAIVVFTLIRTFNVVWLQYWLDCGDGLEPQRLEEMSLSSNVTYSEDELKGFITDHPDLWFYQMIFGLSFIALMISGIAKGLGVTFRVLAGATKLHQDMYDSILRAPIKFVEITPVGRILTRFSRDLDEIDVRIPFFMEFVSQGMLSIFAQIILVCAIFPFFILPLIIVVFFFVMLDLFLNAGVRELKRLDNNLKSPVLQHMASSMSGLSIIRTFDKENIFIKRFNKLLDEHSAALLVFRLSNRWFTYRMDFMGTIVIMAITIICIFTKGQYSTALVGLALTSVNGVCSFIPFLMRMKSEFQARMTSVERVMEYAYDIESEAPLEIEATKPAPGTWPSKGKVVLKEVKLRYRPELPLVLHGVSASIEPAEKIGIVGRTGAGKSTLISTLLRFVELESGCVEIDGIDISYLGLRTLRSSISVIPQDPVLFQGSVRYNIDPFDEHSDEAVWTAFERAQLKSAIQKLPSKLYSEVEASGENFSVGEKQLICLARALLKNSKILLLDEATASVDIETDHLIQETLKEAFKDCTVLTIAHRLNTVASYDRIMVLDAGKVSEFDSPENLMSNKNSLFREMMEAMGIHNVEQMKALS